MLRTLTASREREAELEALCVDAPADAGGHWSAKDHLAHLTAWRNRAATLLDAVRTEVSPPDAVENDPENARIYAATRDQSLEEVMRNASASWDRLRAALEGYSEEDLMRPHPHAEGHQIWEIVPGVGGHLGTHLMWWHLEMSDPSGAEGAALWARDLEYAVFSDPQRRADATYNLACFYSRIGNVEKALPLLRESLAADPDLVKWARKDPDLDPVRDDPELKELLAD